MTLKEFKVVKRKPPKNFRPIKLRACVTCNDFQHGTEYADPDSSRFELAYKEAFCKRNPDFEIIEGDLEHYHHICDYWKKA